jgi:hypothetical protein
LIDSKHGRLAQFEQLKDDLLGVIQETMQPERVSLWLKAESGG